MYPVIALIVLVLFTWIVAIGTPCGENDEPHDEEKPEKNSDEQTHQEIALKQDVSRLTASPLLQQKRLCVISEKTCCYTNVFRVSDGGCHDL